MKLTKSEELTSKNRYIKLFFEKGWKRLWERRDAQGAFKIDFPINIPSEKRANYFTFRPMEAYDICSSLSDQKFVLLSIMAVTAKYLRVFVNGHTATAFSGVIWALKLLHELLKRFRANAIWEAELKPQDVCFAQIKMFIYPSEKMKNKAAVYYEVKELANQLAHLTLTKRSLSLKRDSSWVNEQLSDNKRPIRDENIGSFLLSKSRTEKLDHFSKRGNGLVCTNCVWKEVWEEGLLARKTKIVR